MEQQPETRYEPPALTVLGSLAGATSGSSSGDKLDQDFPAGTLFSDLSFS